MKKLLGLKIKTVVILYILIDTICMGMGMGVPIFCIFLGFPSGWYITQRISSSTEQLYQKYYKILKLSLYAAFFTFILMLVVWGWTIPKSFDSSFDFQNFGLPNFLYDPKISFIGWHILMIIISPFLQLLTIIFAAFLTLFRNEKNLLLLPVMLLILTDHSQAQNVKNEYKVSVSNISLSDPFIFADTSDNTYYMYGSGGNGAVMCRASKDLENWTDRFTVYQFPADHWAGPKAPCWAAEVHKYKGKYYLFTTSDDGKPIGKNILGNNYPHRATQIYVAESPRGPFSDFTNNKPHTPHDWPCLDGTFWIEDGVPYLVFCHEWTQIMNGTVEAVRLPKDLGVPDKPPFTLFTGFEAPFITESQPDPRKSYVTDGCFLFKTKTGKLGMIWSSWKGRDYVLMAAYSNSGKLKGPWIQDKELLFEENGGHGMLFHTFEGKLMLSMHYVDPKDDRPRRKPVFMEMDDSGDRLKIKKEGLVIK